MVVDYIETKFLSVPYLFNGVYFDHFEVSVLFLITHRTGTFLYTVIKCWQFFVSGFKPSGLQNVRFQNVWFQNVLFLNLIYLLNKKYRDFQVCTPI